MLEKHSLTKGFEMGRAELTMISELGTQYAGLIWSAVHSARYFVGLAPTLLMVSATKWNPSKTFLAAL